MPSPRCEGDAQSLNGLWIYIPAGLSASIVISGRPTWSTSANATNRYTGVSVSPSHVPDWRAETWLSPKHNRLVAEDARYVRSILPIQDGVMAALRIK